MLVCGVESRLTSILGFGWARAVCWASETPAAAFSSRPCSLPCMVCSSWSKWPASSACWPLFIA